VEEWGGEAPPSSASATLPTAYALESVRPNPFRGAATVRFGLPEAAAVRLVLYDALGRQVAVLVPGEAHAPGWHEVSLDGHALPSGAYVLRLEAGSHVEARRVTLLR
jgi:hypothetical protein